MINPLRASTAEWGLDEFAKLFMVNLSIQLLMKG